MRVYICIYFFFTFAYTILFTLEKTKKKLECTVQSIEEERRCKKKKKKKKGLQKLHKKLTFTLFYKMRNAFLFLQFYISFYLKNIDTSCAVYTEVREKEKRFNIKLDAK